MLTEPVGDKEGEDVQVGLLLRPLHHQGRAADGRHSHILWLGWCILCNRQVIIIVLMIIM